MFTKGALSVACFWSFLIGGAITPTLMSYSTPKPVVEKIEVIEPVDKKFLETVLFQLEKMDKEIQEIKEEMNEEL